MWRYLPAAFFARLPVPGLGAVPVNALAVAAVVALGFIHPGFWLVGAAGEAAFLFGLASSPRFQRAVDARARGTRLTTSPAAQRAALTAQLSPASRRRLTDLAARCARALSLAQRNADYLLADARRFDLERLEYHYLKLLLARETLEAQDAQVSGSALRRQIDQLRAEVESAQRLGGSEASIDSKRATLRIAEQRLELWQRRGQVLADVDANLERIEAKVNLAIESGRVTLPGGVWAPGQDPLSGLPFADATLFGSAAATVEALDRAYGRSVEESG